MAGWHIGGSKSLMLQDSLTCTKVALVKGSEKIECGPTPWRLPHPKSAMFAVLVGVLAGIFLQGFFGGAGLDQSTMEADLARELGIRTRACG